MNRDLVMQLERKGATVLELTAAQEIRLSYEKIGSLIEILSRVKEEDIRIFINTGAFALPEDLRAKIQKGFEE